MEMQAHMMTYYYDHQIHSGILPQDPLMANPNYADHSQIIATHVQNQTMEVDHFIKSENEKLKVAVQEQTKRHAALLVQKYQSRIQFLITQKEDEIANAAKRRMELQECLKRMESEKQIWQRIAQENEGMAASMNNTIQRLRESAQDAESCCIPDNWDVVDEGGAVMRKKMSCRWCNIRNCCVVVLPCRHLCSCKECEPLLMDSCPVCKMVKKATIQAFL